MTKATIDFSGYTGADLSPVARAHLRPQRRHGRLERSGQNHGRLGTRYRYLAPSPAALEVEVKPLHYLRVSKVEQMEVELRKLSQSELRQIRQWLDDKIEDELEFTPEFERSILKAERDMADGKSARCGYAVLV